MKLNYYNAQATKVRKGKERVFFKACFDKQILFNDCIEFQL